MAGVLIVGAGQAGSQLATTLRQKGYAEAVTIVGDEPALPYQRPPLSKAFLTDGGAADSVLLRAAAFYAERDIAILPATTVRTIDRSAATATLSDGSVLDYDHLVLATGARNRVLAGVEHALQLRTVADAVALRGRLRPGRRLVIVGGGFIGLELASSASKLGVEVTVVESVDHLMARVASPELADHLRTCAERAGVRIVLSAAVAAVDGGGVVLRDGRALPADNVVVAVGVVPNTELASACGLDVADGIVVDELLRTTDPAISAIGDCARHHCAVTGRSLRLESVQNASDQARFVAERLTGAADPYRAVPWFWTEQHGRRVQIAGVADPAATSVVAGDPTSGSFSVLRFADERLVAVESVDRVADHMAARKLLASGAAARVAPHTVADPRTTLKQLAADLTVGAHS